MEDLSKNQLLLLTLLVNFVTSIATGIVTVSLLDEAPPNITQTINRVVEKTIEKVVPAEGQKATVITREQVRVVSSDDLIVAAIDRNKESLIRMRGFPEGASEVNEGEYYGLGLVVSKDGLILTDINLVQDGIAYRGRLSNGANVALELVKTDRASRLALFKAKPLDAGAVAWTPATIGSADTLRVGQSVVAIGKTDHNVIAPGSITSLIEQKVEVASSTRTVTAGIEVSTEPKPLSVGSIIVNTAGEVVATYRYLSDGSGRFGTLLGAKELIVSLETSKPAKK